MARLADVLRAEQALHEADPARWDTALTGSAAEFDYRAPAPKGFGWVTSESNEWAGRIRSAVGRVPVIVADNVAEYYFRGEAPSNDFDVQRLPALAPPFPEFYVEMRRPSWMEPDGWFVRGWGAHFEVSEKQDDPVVRWEMRARHVVHFHKSFFPGGFIVLSDPAIITVAHDGRPVACIHEKGMGWTNYTAPLLATIAFMNCANVARDVVDPPPRLSKRHAERHGQPLLRYHVIRVVEKVGIRDRGSSDATGQQKALHICRGHFATYTAESPLFGHFVGTVWKPAHVRGSADSGIVVSDYRVGQRAAPAQPSLQPQRTEEER